METGKVHQLESKMTMQVGSRVQKGYTVGVGGIRVNLLTCYCLELAIKRVGQFSGGTPHLCKCTLKCLYLVTSDAKREGDLCLEMVRIHGQTTVQYIDLTRDFGLAGWTHKTDRV